MSDWVWPAATVFATLVGPILAVQAQKWVERAKEREHRKAWVFTQLMGTRRNRLAVEHVQALNMIDLAFYGRRQRGKQIQAATEKAVTQAWHEYLKHLSSSQEDREAWDTRSNELLADLLSAIADDVGYSFDRAQLENGAYSPVAHGEQELHMRAQRQLLGEVLAGDRAIKMAVTDFPFVPAAVDAQIKLQDKLTDALGDDGALRVTMVNSAGKRDGSGTTPSR